MSASNTRAGTANNSAPARTRMAPPPVVKFVASDDSGLPLKRKQVSQACQECRKKKKRCIHARKTSSPGAANTSRFRQVVSPRQGLHVDAVLPHSPLSLGESRDGDEGASQVAATQLVELSSRFVGDLNPEGLFIQATASRASAAESSYRDKSDLGIWLPPHSTPPEVPGHEGTGITRSPLDAGHLPEDTQSSLRGQFERARREYLEKECLLLLPPEEDFRVLRRIFREKIHPIFSAFNDEHLDRDTSSSIFASLTAQVIALAAAADAEASAHLRLTSGGPLLSFREFHQRLSTAVIAVLDADLLVNRVDLIRVLAILALFYQPSNPRERDRAALFYSQAVHHLQTLGAHLRDYRPQRPDENIERLFCAVWALDKLETAFYARPRLLHERDIGRDLDDCIKKQPPCFQLFLRVIQYMEKAIILYQPRQEFVHIDLPVLETLMVDASAEKHPIPLLGTIEVLYHAVSVLSCRQKSSAFTDNPPADDFSYIPPSSVNPRRSLSADRIVWVTQNQEICPFPFVPYAVSLALTVQYRKMRYSRTAMFRNRARGIFKEIVTTLNDMGGVFSTARVNARLGERILKEMEKTASSLARDENVESGVANSKVAKKAEVPQQIPSGSGGNVQVGTPLTDSPVAQPASDSDTSIFDPTILDNLDVDVDLFGYFDPSFDLLAIDTALEANLDMGIPQNWTTPWSHAGT